MTPSLEINKIAAYLASIGVAKGDFVAVFMTNSPEMVMTILALSKLSAVAALINTNLRGIFLSLVLDVANESTR